MNNEKDFVKEITNIEEDFAKWYTDIVLKADLADYTDTKGCIAIKPYGYAIWENIQKYADEKFKKVGVKNVYFPVLIPESLLEKEKDHVEGFAPEVAWVTIGGNEELDEKLCIRPTSETMFSTLYAKWLKSWRDLPFVYNQWCNVLRWEKETRPFLRSREFLWQEGHTIHETEEEAIKETKQMMDVYKWFHHEILAIPSITGLKTEKEKFAGAEFTLTNEALMYNGVSLQAGTSHYFGQKFSKAYNIKFQSKENKEEYVYQTSWGTATRMIGALIMVHGDDKGLVLPPRIAPKQVVIIPIGKDERVFELSNKLNKELNDNNIVTYIDTTDRTPGYKFAEAEVNGIPVRIEIGPRDLDNNKITFARRDTSEKVTIDLDQDLVVFTKDLLEKIQKNLYDKAVERRDALTFTATNMDEMKKILDTQPGFIHADWCGNSECEVKIKELKGCKSRCITEDALITGKCVCCGKDAKHHVIWGLQY